MRSEFILSLCVREKNGLQQLEYETANQRAVREGTGSPNGRDRKVRSPACMNRVPGYVADRHKIPFLSLSSFSSPRL
jgi:hypothetical protein